MKLLEENKKSLLSLVLSVIGAGFFISLLTNIIFKELYDENRIIFIIVCCISMIMVFFFLCQVIYRLDKKVIKVTLPTVFDVRKNQFIDLPHSPTSVNARVLFNNLSAKQRAMVNSEEERFSFVDSFMVQLIFTLVFDHSFRKSNIEKWIPVDRKYLQDILVNYRYIDIDEIVGEGHKGTAVLLPKGFKIKSVKEDSIYIASKQGFIKFSWDINGRRPCQEELFFVAQIEDVDISGCWAYNVDVTLEYGYKPMKLFMRSTKDLDNYLEHCVEELKSYDIYSIIEEVKMIYMTEVMKKLDINTYKECMPVIRECVKKK